MTPGGAPHTLPAAVRLDSRALAAGDGVYPELRRRYGPVAPVLLEGEVPAWLVLGYREVRYVTAHPELFARDSRRWNAWDRVPRDWPLLPYVARSASVLTAEGAEHRRKAGAITDVLSGVDPFGLRTSAERAADAAIDRFAGAGRAELMAQYAGQVPQRVMAGLLGLRDDEALEIEEDVAATLGDDGPRAAAAHARIHGTVQVLLERGRRQPGADLASRLLAHPARLTHDEAVQDLIALLAAAVRPTADWIGNTLRLMLTDDRFAVSLSGGRRSAGQALAEVLWTDSPAQNVVGRWAVHDAPLGGRHIRRGDCLVLGLAAANADPQVCPYPRDGGPAAGPAAAGNQAHLSFSHGEHGCPAPAPELAEAIATAAVEVLLDRLPDLRLACPPEALTWRPSLWSRGPATLPVAFTALV
ncbi:cytochrome P450 [Streptomyces sp. V4-01]|uniref:Cytochrome P450 n=1 Tax=Actinacidiphila polyblastidii TaxID=3110430 RepID=A0ABU7PHN6_9ACTN|nr:cytochrome P450 [Streptomyces sp. V4-01]